MANEMQIYFTRSRLSFWIIVARSSTAIVFIDFLSLVYISTAWLQECSWYDDVVKWKHFPRYWSFVWRFHQSPVHSPHRGQWRGALMCSLICAWTNSSVTNRDAGDLRRNRAPYDVTAILLGNESRYPAQVQCWGIRDNVNIFLPFLTHI